MEDYIYTMGPSSYIELLDTKIPIPIMKHFLLSRWKKFVANKNYSSQATLAGIYINHCTLF